MRVAVNELSGYAFNHIADIEIAVVIRYLGVEYYLQHRVKRLEQVQRAVRQGATSAREVVEIVYADVPREVWPAAETTVMAQLEYLSSQGELD